MRFQFRKSGGRAPSAAFSGSSPTGLVAGGFERRDCCSFRRTRGGRERPSVKRSGPGTASLSFLALAFGSKSKHGCNLISVISVWMKTACVDQCHDAGFVDFCSS